MSYEWRNAPGIKAGPEWTNPATAPRDYSVVCVTGQRIAFHEGYNVWWCKTHWQPMAWCQRERTEAQLRAAQERVAELERERGEDSLRLDWLADERVFDGINGLDIDELTLDALHSTSHDPYDEEGWRLEWRKQMRVAIAAALKAAKEQG